MDMPLIPTIGTPAIGTYDQTGYVCNVSRMEAGIYLISGATLRPQRLQYKIVWQARGGVPGGVSTVSEDIARRYFADARKRNISPVSPEIVETMCAEAARAEAEREATEKREREERNREFAAFQEVARRKTPAWAKAVITAELMVDDSDTMTDYFASHSSRTVILAFSRHTRDLFPEMRKAARNFPETAYLADLDGSAEHREKYSMGDGYYLQKGCSWSGWRVHKQAITDFRGVPFGEWSLPVENAPKTAKKTPAHKATAPGGVTISEHVHTKKGFKMWIVALAERVSRDEYLALLATAKDSGGWYSRAWKDSPAGFAFKDKAAAETFAADLQGADKEPAAQDKTPASGNKTASNPNKTPADGNRQAEKFRALADGLQDAIKEKMADRLENTPKRRKQALQARQEGDRLKRTQQALRVLADLHAAGNVPPELQTVTSKKAVYELCREKITSNGQYYDAGFQTGEAAETSPAARTLWQLLKGPDPEERKARALRDKVSALQFANIPGYFPTPAAVVDQMIAAADIPADGCRVLEPSAGSGAIVDRLRQACPACEPVVFERQHSLREILTDKGYTLAGDDFMQSPDSLRVERVLMNPPFEKGQDMDHVQRAFSCLLPGGVLVAIMGAGAFFRHDRKADQFRAWFFQFGGEVVKDLPSGTFKESGTGAAAVMVKICR